MKRSCYMGILKEGFSAYSSLVMLISRKLTKDKRMVTDFRHLNVRIAKNNLASPLVRDTFFSVWKFKMWGSISVKFEGCLSLFEIVREFKETLWNTSILWYLILLISKNANGSEHFTIHMSIIHQCNIKLSPKQEIQWSNYGWSYIVYFIKRISYEQIGRHIDWKYHPRSANYSKPAYNTWEMKYLLKTKRYAWSH